MGSAYDAVCTQCGHRFRVHEGGGFAFHLLHCDQCGSGREVGFEELGEAHLRYIKGLDVPYSGLSEKPYGEIQKKCPGTPISEEEYDAAVEEIAGLCSCGGHYRLRAPARCPQCHSSEVQPVEGSTFMFYD